MNFSDDVDVEEFDDHRRLEQRWSTLNRFSPLGGGEKEADEGVSSEEVDASLWEKHEHYTGGLPLENRSVESVGRLRTHLLWCSTEMSSGVCEMMVYGVVCMRVT